MTRQYIRDCKLYVNSAGSNSNDGLSAGQPLQTLEAAISAIYADIDCGGTQPEIILQSDVVHTGNVIGQIVGSNFFKIRGEGAQRKISAAPNGTHVFQFGDGAQLGLENVEVDMTTSVSTANAVHAALFGHQFGVLDTGQNVAVRGRPGDLDIYTDYGTQININGGLKLRGNRYKVAQIGPMSVLNVNNDLVSEGACCGGQLFQFDPNSYGVLQGNVRFLGAWGGSFRQYYIAPNATFRKLCGAAITIPGTEGYREPGGLYVTA